MSNSAKTNSTKNSTQSAQIKPDLSHRLRSSEYDPGCHVQLSDAINNMVDRASGVLNLLQFSYTGESECQPSDAIVFNAIESAVQELADIRATVDAFHSIHFDKWQSERKAEKKQQA